jgi:hypothetical protein
MKTIILFFFNSTQKAHWRESHPKWHQHSRHWITHTRKYCSSGDKCPEVQRTGIWPKWCSHHHGNYDALMKIQSSLSYSICKDKNKGYVKKSMKIISYKTVYLHKEFQNVISLWWSEFGVWNKITNILT